MKKIIPIVIIVFVAAGIYMFNIFKKGQKAHSPKTESMVEFVQENPGIIIDVRTQEEYDDGHLADADYQYDFLSGEFESKLDSLDKSKTYYLYCRSGNRSGQSTKIMKEKGFENVYNIGGYKDLVNSGFSSSNE